VTLIEFTGRSILLCSDIEAFAQGQLLRMYPGLKADVVVVPHHGSAATSDKEFLNRLNAKILIYSCDRTQYERITRAAQGSDENSDSAKAFYTAEDGTITVRVARNGALNADCFQGGPE